jgi:hypothetical protein
VFDVGTTTPPEAPERVELIRDEVLGERVEWHEWMPNDGVVRAEVFEPLARLHCHCRARSHDELDKLRTIIRTIDRIPPTDPATRPRRRRRS